MAYEYLNLENVTKLGIYEIMIYANTVTSNYFFMLLTIAIFIIVFISLKIYPTEKAFAGSSFITFVIATLFFIINLISFYFWMAILFILAFAIISLKISGSKDF